MLSLEGIQGIGQLAPAQYDQKRWKVVWGPVGPLGGPQAGLAAVPTEWGSRWWTLGRRNEELEGTIQYLMLKFKST